MTVTSLATVLAGLTISAGQASAACTGLPATEGPNTITCGSGINPAIDALGGNDTITVNAGEINNGVNTSFIAGNGGDDTFNVNGGVLSDIFGDSGAGPSVNSPGNDTINLGTASGGTAIVKNSVRGNRGSDTFNLWAGSVDGNVHGDEDSDTMNLLGATVRGSFFGGTGNDVLKVLSGSVGGTVQSGAQNDEITIGDVNNPSAAGPTIGLAVDGSLDDDKILIISGTMQSVTGNTGNDTIWLYGGTISQAVTGGTGVDTIILGGQAQSDLIPLVSSYLGSATAGSSLLSIQGGADDDTITLNAGTVTSTGDAVTGDEGNDRITLNGVALNGRITGGTGADTFKIVSGSTTAVDGGADDDTFFLSGGTVAGAVLGGDGNDSFDIGATELGVVTAGTAIGGEVQGGADNDTFFLSGGTVAGSVLGGDGNDRFDIGATGLGVLTAGTAISGNVLGGSGDDTFNWRSGNPFASGGLIDGGAGSDVMLVSAASGYDGTQTLNGGDDALPGDGFIDRLTVTGKTTATKGSKLLNWESITLAGGGLTLTDGLLATGDASNATTGLFLTGGAYLHTGSALALTGNLSIASGSRLDELSGNAHTISGRLQNAGVVNLQDGGANDVLSVGADYVGGGQLLVDVSGDIADVMTVGGNVTGAPTEIGVHTLGANTTGIPIDVVRVQGTTAAGDFTSAGFVLGAYSYALQLAGSTWQFAPTATTDQGTLYPTVSGMLGLFAQQTVGTHFQRSGSWSRARATGDVAAPQDDGSSASSDGTSSNTNVWFRGIGQWADGEGTLKGATGTPLEQSVSYDRNIGGLQGGVDFVMMENASVLVTGGFFGQVGRATSDAKNETSGKGAGSAEADAKGVGAKIGVDTHNFYAELVGGWNFYDISTRANPGINGDTQGNGYFVSVEGGYEVDLSHGVKLIPQAQFAWLGTDIDNMTDEQNATIAFSNNNATTGRLGLALDALAGTVGDEPLRLTGIFNYWQVFGDPLQTTVDGSPLELEQDGGSVEVGGGFHWGTDSSPLHLHGEVTYRDAVNGDGEQAWFATAGARVAF